MAPRLRQAHLMEHQNQPSSPADPAAEDLIPVGVWVRVSLPDFPDFVGFTYVDRQAGLSAKGEAREGESEIVGMTVRLPLPGIQALSEAEVDRLGLPVVPSWLEVYGPQPKPGTLWGSWRRHPKLQGRFHEEYPDDVQVMVHDGGPRLTSCQPEIVWVRVSGGEGDTFTGRVLNRPHHLQTVSENSEIRFIVPEIGEHPLMVTEKYLAERPHWDIIPCNRCGLSELLDAPSDLIRVVFPNLPADSAECRMFTAFCGACGGILVVQVKDTKAARAARGDGASRKKKWWQFWK